jgi:hypothetical protein
MNPARIMRTVPLETESVTLRRLPDGAEIRGPLEERQQEPLRVAVGTDGGAGAFAVGSAVEVWCARFLYLGEVIALQGGSVVVEVKHALDRAALAAIQDVWQDVPRARSRS